MPLAGSHIAASVFCIRTVYIYNTYACAVHLVFHQYVFYQKWTSLLVVVCICKYIVFSCFLCIFGMYLYFMVFAFHAFDQKWWRFLGGSRNSSLSLSVWCRPFSQLGIIFISKAIISHSVPADPSIHLFFFFSSFSIVFHSSPFLIIAILCCYNRTYCDYVLFLRSFYMCKKQKFGESMSMSMVNLGTEHSIMMVWWQENHWKQWCSEKSLPPHRLEKTTTVEVYLPLLQCICFPSRPNSEAEHCRKMCLRRNCLWDQFIGDRRKGKLEWDSLHVFFSMFQYHML